MEESIYISNFRNNIETISEYMAISKINSKFNFSSVHYKDDILQIILKKGNRLDVLFIEQYKLTCVIENNLFRTVYIKGTKVLWKSLND
jgi:hypothetical protein